MDKSNIHRWYRVEAHYTSKHSKETYIEGRLLFVSPGDDQMEIETRKKQFIGELYKDIFDYLIGADPNRFEFFLVKYELGNYDITQNEKTKIDVDIKLLSQ